MKFPEDWPTGCPSADTADAAGEVFRIVKEDPVSPGDVLSHHETRKLPRADPCLRCGLSVFRDRDDARYQQQLLPKLGSLIARGVLAATHGKACLTKGQQPSHTTWWPYEGVERAALFIVSPDVT